MTVTVTSIKLKKLWHFFILSYLGLKIQLGIKSKSGFLQMKNTGFGYLHYTMTAWASEDDAKNFAHSAEHLNAMNWGKTIATEVRVLTFEAEQMPDWNDAKQMVLEKGRVISYR